MYYNVKSLITTKVLIFTPPDQFNLFFHTQKILNAVVLSPDTRFQNDVDTPDLPNEVTGPTISVVKNLL